MKVEINIASCHCAICKTHLVDVKGFADTPFGRNGSWAYICEGENCAPYISRAFATRFDVVIQDGFAIGRKRTKINVDGRN